MEKFSYDPFSRKYASDIQGILQCFDRIVIKGRIQVLSTKSLINWYLRKEEIPAEEFAKFAQKLRDELKAHIEEFALKNKIPIVHISKPTKYNKEEEIHKIIESRKITEGYVAILTVMELGNGYRCTTGNLSEHWIKPNTSPCLHYYIYFIDQTLGLTYVRIQTYLPIELQVYFNGHNYLAIKLKKNGMRFRMTDNGFTMIEEYGKAQKLADSLKAEKLHKILDAFAHRFIPFLGRQKWEYRWTIMQSEYSTDVIFREANRVKEVYEGLSHRSILCIKPSQVATYFETSYTMRTKRIVTNRIEEGISEQGQLSTTRVKHQKGANSIKMYNKPERILRIETTINKPQELRTKRSVRHCDGTITTEVAYLSKSIYSLHLIKQISKAANQRYLETLACFDDNSIGSNRLESIASAVYHNHRSYAGFNICKKSDLRLIRVIERGEFAISGIRNKDIRKLLPDLSASTVSRIIRRMRDHHLLRKVANGYRYFLTELGRVLCAEALRLIHLELLPALS